MRVHAVALAVAVDPDGPLAGALILGASGSGKSSLALAAIEACPFRRTALVSDDVVMIAADKGAYWAAAPAAIAGLIEVRGYGPARIRTANSVRLLAGFDLSAPAERMPAPRLHAFEAGLTLPVYPLLPQGDAALRLRAALRTILGGQTL